MTRHFLPQEVEIWEWTKDERRGAEYLLQFCAKCKFKFFPIVIVGVLFALRCKHSTPFPGHKTNDKLKHTLALVSFWGFPHRHPFPIPSTPVFPLAFSIVVAILLLAFSCLVFPSNLYWWKIFKYFMIFVCCHVVVVDRSATKCMENFNLPANEFLSRQNNNCSVQIRDWFPQLMFTSRWILFAELMVKWISNDYYQENNKFIYLR